MSAEPSMRFEVGRVYLHHSGWTAGHVFLYTVVKRTAKTVVVMCHHSKSERKCVVRRVGDTEYVRIGRYANAPTIDARLHMDAVDDPVVESWKRLIRLNETTDRLADY